ncbi:DUF2591 domain-containing protein [Enterobacter hormaechei subsp. steigerwaltii]|nr:DUF2591 domain-containing protein [Enterobacter hormaechei subsp. steigerwaltii]
MDYSQLSDFEINKRVGIALGKELMPDECQDFGLSGLPEVMLRSGDIKDYCNDPSDAWPIIDRNRIGVMPSEMKTKELWMSTSGKGSYAYHENPFRAAMIVFLQMQGPNHA